jgi:predicted Mrr-cat superfamily restriction endonuclease
MNLWRINLKPANRTGYDSRKHCLENKIVGIGWPLDDITEFITSETYETAAKMKYQLNAARGWSNAWNAIYHKMQIDDLVWTRTTDGNYFLGRITSEWRYDFSSDAVNNDIANVRDCEWVKVGIIDKVPGKVVRSFIPSSTLQRVIDNTALTYSQHLFNSLSGLNFYESTSSTNEDIFSLLSADDCEDIVGLYLQVKFDYIIIPSSCKDDTLAYEYELIHRISSEKAVVQVKNGNVDLDRNNYKAIDDAKVFLFTTSQRYLGEKNNNVICLGKEELQEFMSDYQNLLPQKVKLWVEKLSL